ncbi:MAG: LCP family protein [Ruminococcaceae bacterium]|nr:LCP family protein [Oscillospiraceae bacterium]
MSNRQHSYNSGRIRRSGAGQAGSIMPENTYKAAPSKGKGGSAVAKPRVSRGKKVLIIVILILVVLAGVLFFLYRYVDGIFEPGSFGSITQNDPNKKYVPRDYNKSDVVHILLVGIDNEEGRGYGEGLGLTDMLLYMRYDLKNNQLNMLQIPRDSYVGENYATGGTGKINALLNCGEDRENPINNIAGAIEEMFHLPVDHYISMDMDAMKAIVDTFGGLKVYVPRDMSYGGSYLQQGWRWLDGDAAEFFVRNRNGTGFERADIDRLDNQRHFYSALFRRLLNLTGPDIVNLLPVFEHYCNTDIGLTDIFDIAYSALNLTPDRVLFCKAPGTTGMDPGNKGRSLYLIDLYGRGTDEDPGLATLLNTYFRDADRPVAASALGLPQVQIPSGYTLYPPNVQVMSEVQEPEGGADVDVEPQAA